jgi:hypothetical protein
MRSERNASRWAPSLYALAIVLASFAPASAVPADPARAAGGDTLTVRQGDSWGTIRARLYPLEALRAANPEITRRGLQPGDIVRAPFVPSSALENAERGRRSAEQLREQSEARRKELETRMAAVDSLQRELNEARGARTSLRIATFVLLLLTLALAVGTGLALRMIRSARRESRLAGKRLGDVKSSYERLRSSLRGIEIELQRRMVNLLHLHGARVITDKEAKAATRPVIELATELKKKHAS